MDFKLQLWWWNKEWHIYATSNNQLPSSKRK